MITMVHAAAAAIGKGRFHEVGRLIGSMLALAAALAVGAPRAVAQQNEVTSDEVVTALEGAYGVHPGQRRNHTKGTCALGTFVGVPEAVAYSRSALFSGAWSRWWRGSPWPVEIRRRPMPSGARGAWPWSSGCPTAGCST